MPRKNFCTVLLLLMLVAFTQAQPQVRETTRANRDALYKRLISNSIQRNLSLPIADSTEANWMRAFDALAVTRYQSPWTHQKIKEALDSCTHRSFEFQQSLMQLIQGCYPKKWPAEINHIFNTSSFYRIRVYAAVITRQTDSSLAQKQASIVHESIPDSSYSLFEQVAQQYIRKEFRGLTTTQLRQFMEARLLPGEVVVFSIQPRNRNYPGRAIIRMADGQFMKDSTGLWLSVPQLARSMYNLPFFLPCGNTPQGIYRMQGTAVSKTLFIGPTPNLQMVLPGEVSVARFFSDTTLTDTLWTLERYQSLLPTAFQHHRGLQESFYAGLLGRSEIIAHGSTVDPAWYIREPAYPITPSLGCLSTREIWDESTGRLQESDQQKLTQAVIQANGTSGLLVVVNWEEVEEAISTTQIDQLLSNRSLTPDQTPLP